MSSFPTPVSRSRARRVLLNCSVLILSVGLSLGFAEAALRIAAPQQLILIRPDLWQPADTVGWTLRPNVDAQVNTGEGRVRLLTDGDGFRTGAGGRREGMPVLLLGDSFMEALQVEYEQSLAGVLDVSLSSALHTPVAVRNAGIGGWSPSQYLLRARMLLPREDYRLVITAVYVGNDAQPVRVEHVPPRTQIQRHRFHIPDELTRSAVVDAGLRPLNDFLEERSHLFIMLRNSLQTLRMKAGVSALYFPQEFLRSEASAARWGLAADVCSDINELAARHGARALFLLIPADFQVKEEKFRQYVRGFDIDTAAVDLDQPTRRLKAEMERRGLLVIDALPEFRARTRNGATLYGVVDQHLSEQGHRALAELVTPVAADLLADM